MAENLAAQDSDEARADQTGSQEPSREALLHRIAELERQLNEAKLTQERDAVGPLKFQALRLIEGKWGEGWQIRPSPTKRQWMNLRPYAYQCLPMVVANQWGWQILCPTDISATWNGQPGADGVTITVTQEHLRSIKSQFGNGIVTFSPPWLFRTSPGWDLYLKGPSNRWKPNCVSLDGVIETWWLNYTFTINWKIVEPGTVTFAKGESIGQLIPVPHATFKDAEASESPIGTAEPEAAEELMRWLEERRKRAGEPVRTHGLYRKAENIDEHLTKIQVPEVTPTWKTDK